MSYITIRVDEERKGYRKCDKYGVNLMASFAFEIEILAMEFV